MGERLYRAGLILEGGGMRGVYTAGVLDCFLDEGLFFDRCYGVSARACQACSYLSRQRDRGRATAMDYLRDRRCASLWSLRRTGDYFGAAFLYDLLPNEIYPYDYDAFRAYAGTFYAVVTDCETGAAEYRPVRDMRSDIVYVRASSSLPLLSRMVEADGRRYLDGGIADSIPLRRAEADGREKNVVVLTRARDYRKGKNRAMFAIRRRYSDYPRLVEAVETRHLRYNETLELIREREAAGRAFVIAPTAPVKIGRLEKNRDRLWALYRAGYRDAARLMPALRRFLADC